MNSNIPRNWAGSAIVRMMSTAASRPDSTMIARMWHGRTKAADADQYLDYLNQSGIPDYRRTPGNLGAWVFRRIEGDVAHFITLTFWESCEAIHAFAGDNIELARYYPEDKRYLLEFEPGVVHYEVFGNEP